MRVSLRPQVSLACTFDDANLAGVVDRGNSNAVQRRRSSWRDASICERCALMYSFADWTLRWDLAAEGTGTRLIFEQSGFDLDNPQHRFAFDHMGPGWRDEVLPKLAAEAGRDATSH